MWFFKGRRQEKLETKGRNEAIFRVRPENQICQASINEVESANRVKDPLGAVPDLPFDHLNMVRSDFLDNRPEGAKLWSFACDWTSEWVSQFSRKGYVWASVGALTPWMLIQDFAKEDDHD